LVPGAEAPPALPWITLWQDAFTDRPAQFNPERIIGLPYVDRTTGEAFLSTWDFGVWKSSDAGKTFARVDGGKIGGPGCGPISLSVQMSPQGKCMALFNMNNAPGPSGYSLDGGRTWESFEPVGRNWDFGAMDFQSKTVFAARHEDDGLHLSRDAGKTWTRLARSRGAPFVTGVGVTGRDLLLATGNTIERSTDGGAAWVKVSDLGGFGPALLLGNRLWWFSGEAKRSLIFSSDGGQSWTVQGAPLPVAPMSTPQFGKDERHVVVVTKAGLYETVDGCRTWKLAVPTPDDYTLYSAAFDPVDDVFYMLATSTATRARSLMRYERSSRPDVALVAGATPRVPGPQPRPKAELVDAPRPRIRVLNPLSIDVCGDFFYVAGEDGIIYFRRDLATGKLLFGDQLGEFKCGGYTLRAAGGRLYAVTPHDGYRRMTWNGLAWYEIDPQTGKPRKKGIVACPASRQMLVGPGQKDLYMKACGGRADRLFWYRIGAGGEPAKAGEVAGRGIAPSSHSKHPSILVISPDGANLYCISAADYAIACIQRKPDGRIAYRGAVDLAPVAKHNPQNDGYQWLSLGISPDGRWLYAAIRNGKPGENFYGIFKRDPATGDLTFQETIGGDNDPLANQPAWSMVFAPGAAGGYLGNWSGPLLTFQYDARSGHLTHPGAVAGTAGYGCEHTALDAAHGLLYAAGGEVGTVLATLCVLKVPAKE
jgi:hypothetical protein